MILKKVVKPSPHRFLQVASQPQFPLVINLNVSMNYYYYGHCRDGALLTCEA